MKVKTLLSAMLVLSCCSAGARSLHDNHIDSLVASTKIIDIDGGHTLYTAEDTARLRAQIERFYYDQFRHSQDPGSPYFMFISKESGLMMGLGGVVRMRGWYDFGAAVPGNGFLPYTIPMDPSPANHNKLGTTPAGVCLFLRLAGHNRIFGDYQGYIEANFNGYQGRDFHLKKAYVMFRDWTVGYASSSFSDPAAVPSTVDASGPNNKMDHTAVLVRYAPRLSGHVLGGISVETPDTYVAADGVSTLTRSSYIPDVAGFIQYDWGTNASQHVRFAAIYRSLPYRDVLAASNRNVAGWGVQFSSVSHPVDPLTLYLTVNYGAGYAGMGGDLLAGAYDLIGDPNEPGRLYAPRSFGWNVGLQYIFTHNLFVTVSGSQTRFLPSKAISPDEFKYGLMGVVNVFYNPVPRVQLGAEFDFGKRQDFSREHRYARRLGLMAQLSF